MPTPEQIAREKIDAQLAQCGWVVQDYVQMNIGAVRAIAVREFPLKSGHADCMLYVASRPLPFACESTGAETRFTNGLDPDYCSREVFTFHRPEELKRLATAEEEFAEENEDDSLFEAALALAPREPVPVVYNPRLPMETRM